VPFESGHFENALNPEENHFLLQKAPQVGCMPNLIKPLDEVNTQFESAAVYAQQSVTGT